MIRVEGLGKEYGRFEALHDVSFSVPEGSAYALIGSNGAGKTTAIKIIMNILRASKGCASVLGVDSRKLGPAQLQQIGYVSENQEMPIRLRVGEYFSYLSRLYPDWDAALEASLQRRLDLPLDRRIGELSHGMRLKMGLACALAFRPRLLVLDEPFNGLDPLVSDEVLGGLLEYAGDLTILLSSHELSEIEGLATHVGFLQEGHLLFQENMPSLSQRFREVHITFDEEPLTLQPLAPNWLQVRVIGNVLHFIDRNFDELALRGQVKSLFQGVKSIDAQPIELRSIFLAIARDAKGKQPE